MQRAILMRDAATAAPLAPGPSSVLTSSQPLGWNGFIVERHRLPAGERPAGISSHHVIAVLTGSSMSGEYTLGRGRFISFRKHPGAITITPRGEVPYMRSDGPVQAMICALRPEFITGILQESSRVPKLTPRFQSGIYDEALSHLTAMLLNEAEAGNPSGRLYAEHLAQALALKYLSVDPIREAKTQPLPAKDLQRILDYIAANLAGDISLETLAAEARYSRTHFLRMFRESTGLTPHQYVLRERVQRAQGLLKQGTLAVQDVAAETGFSSQSHLTTAFRKVLGTTPEAWRRNS